MGLLSFLLDAWPPDQVVVVAPDGAGFQEVTAQDLRARVEARQDALGDIAQRGVLVACRTPLSYLITALATWAAKGVVLPENLRAPPHPVSVARVAAAVRVTDQGVERLDAPRRYNPRVGLILSTSGSSGTPRQVLLGKEGLMANVEAICSYLPLERWKRPGIVLPLWYSYSLVGQALTALRARATMVLLGDVAFPPLQLDAMLATGVDGLSAVPTALRALAQAAGERPAHERPRLGYVASAGEALHPRVVEKVRAAFPAARFFNQYGLTEASPRVTALDDTDPGFDQGSVGYPLPGVTVTVRHRDGRPATLHDPAELMVDGPSVMLGYLDDPDATRRALTPSGLATGDLGWLDEAGRVYLVARRDDLVKVGGERLSLVAVARELEAHPETDWVVVLAFSDLKRGQRLIAFACSRNPQGLKTWSRQHLAPAARPARFAWLEEVPRTSHGKLDRNRLRAIAAEAGLV